MKPVVPVEPGANVSRHGHDNRRRKALTIQTPSLKKLVIGIGFAATLGFVPTSVAANDASPTGELIVLAQAATIDEGMILAFVDAQARVAEIRAEYTPQFQAAETEQRREEINETAMQEIVTAIDETPGITVEEYDGLIRAAGQDPQLAERINEAMGNSIN